VIPRAEVDALTHSLVEVFALAEDGQVADGHELLLWGLLQAEDVRDEGVLWGDELVCCWQWAVANYACRYHLSRVRSGLRPAALHRPLVAGLFALMLFALALSLTRLVPGWYDGGWAASPNLRGARLAHSTLHGVDLTGVDLRGVDLRGSVLAGASLLNANLTGAVLIGADLTGARLDGARLTGAHLSQADVSRARGLLTADLTGARYDARTRWPDGFDPTASGAVMVTEPGERPAVPDLEPHR
jgi:hypothetical protein